MEKPLTAGAPGLPPGSRGTAHGGGRVSTAGWSTQKEGYARSWIERGVPQAEARAKSEQDSRRSLPDGLATEGALLTVLEHDSVPVGTLWVGLRETDAFVYDVEVDEEHRGQGHGRSLMLLAEGAALAAGRDRIGLNVFAGNTPALSGSTSRSATRRPISPVQAAALGTFVWSGLERRLERAGAGWIKGAGRLGCAAWGGAGHGTFSDGRPVTTSLCDCPCPGRGYAPASRRSAISSMRARSPSWLLPPSRRSPSMT